MKKRDLREQMELALKAALVVVASTAAAWPGCEGARNGPGDPPPQPNYGQETRDTLQAQVDLAPQLYQANATYEPQYANLSLGNLNTILNGNAGNPGYLEQYLKNVVPATVQADQAAQAGQAQGTITNVSQLGPQAVAALKAVNPGAAALLTGLTTQAQQGLDAGTQLTGDQTRQLNNSVAAAQGARGMAYGPAASYAAVLANSQAGQQMQQQRQATAGNVYNLNQQAYTDPFLAMLGRPTQAAQGAAGLLSSGNQLQPGTQFNPDDPNAAAMYSQYNQEMANYNQANSPLAMFGQVASGVGSIMNGAGSIWGGGGA